MSDTTTPAHRRATFDPTTPGRHHRPPHRHGLARSSARPGVGPPDRAVQPSPPRTWLPRTWRRSSPRRSRSEPVPSPAPAAHRTPTTSSSSWPRWAARTVESSAQAADATAKAAANAADAMGKAADAARRAISRDRGGQPQGVRRPRSSSRPRVCATRSSASSAATTPSCSPSWGPCSRRPGAPSVSGPSSRPTSCSTR